MIPLEDCFFFLLLYLFFFYLLKINSGILLQINSQLTGHILSSGGFLEKVLSQLD